MFLNTDNIYIAEKAKNYDCITYGTAGGCNCRAENISYSANGIKFDIVSGDLRFSVRSKLLGMHSALNITAAAAVALNMGLSCEQIAFAVSKLKPVAHRLELKKYIGGSTLIDDAYNANPDGSLEAVRVLGSFEGMTKIIVTPGLVELGEKEYECNARLGEEAGKLCDVIILVGKKRSVPLLDGVRRTNFDLSKLYIADSFADAVKIMQTLCNENTAVLFENDLPDNYAG